MNRCSAWRQSCPDPDESEPSGARGAPYERGPLAWVNGNEGRAAPPSRPYTATGALICGCAS